MRGFSLLMKLMLSSRLSTPEKKNFLNKLTIPLHHKKMKEYVVEYEHPTIAGVVVVTTVEAESKTDARDLFFEQNPTINQILKITWTQHNQ